MKPKFFSLIALVVTLIAQTAPFAYAQVNPDFTPDKLIEDTVFSDTQTFGGPEGVQKFLELKGSVLANTSLDFVAKLKEPSSASLKQGLDDPQPNLPRLRTAAELIWDASKQSGINPQVLLVTLNKEQSLITGHANSAPERLQKALDRALGFDCPDATGCGTLFPGFYYQLFGNFDSEGNRYLGAAKSLMKSFTTPGGRGPIINGRAGKVGEAVELDNTLDPYNPPPRQTVTLTNAATAALYRFTPHVFNGNYNFWKFFREWFRYANGTIIKLSTDSNTYIIQNGSRQLVLPFVAVARGLNTANAITVSPNELSSYPEDKMLGPSDNTIVNVSGTTEKYVFLNNIKRPVSDFVILQRKLDPTKAITISQTEAAVFEQGQVLPPNDGTILKGQSSAAIYLVENGQLKLFSPFTFQQKKAATKMQLVADGEIATYPKQGYVAPNDGTLVKSSTSQTVYLMGQGLKRPISGAVFKNNGYSFKNIAVLSAEEVGSLPIGSYAVPKDRSFFSVGSQVYVYKEGAKHPISAFVAKQRGITPDFAVGSEEAAQWVDGIAIPPRDGTAVKGAASQTVYYVVKGQLRPMTAQAFKNKRLTAKSVTTLSQAEIDAYAKGEVLEK